MNLREVHAFVYMYRHIYIYSHVYETHYRKTNVCSLYMYMNTHADTSKNDTFMYTHRFESFDIHIIYIISHITYYINTLVNIKYIICAYTNPYYIK